MLRRGRERGVGDEVHTRGAERHEGRSRRRHAEAGSTGGVVARATGDDHRAWPDRVAPPPRRASCRPVALPSTSRGMWRRCSCVASSMASDQSRRATSSHKRAGGIGHVGHRLAGESQAHVVLRQQHPRDGLEDLRFVRLHPQQLRGREAGHGNVAGDAAAGRLGRFEFGALRRTAAVVPQDRRAQHAVFGVEQRRAVHLARQTDAAHGGIGLRLCGAQLAPGPPCVAAHQSCRVLLRPQRLRPADRQRRMRAADHGLRFVEQHAP